MADVGMIAPFVPLGGRRGGCVPLHAASPCGP